MREVISDSGWLIWLIKSSTNNYPSNKTGFYSFSLSFSSSLSFSYSSSSEKFSFNWIKPFLGYYYLSNNSKSSS
jgi:hypothetical protein